MMTEEQIKYIMSCIEKDRIDKQDRENIRELLDKELEHIYWCRIFESIDWCRFFENLERKAV